MASQKIWKAHQPARKSNTPRNIIKYNTSVPQARLQPSPRENCPEGLISNNKIKKTDTLVTRDPKMVSEVHGRSSPDVTSNRSADNVE